MSPFLLLAPGLSSASIIRDRTIPHREFGGGGKGSSHSHKGVRRYLASKAAADWRDLLTAKSLKWMLPWFPQDTQQDRRRSLKNSINCAEPRSIGQSGTQSLSFSVRLFRWRGRCRREIGVLWKKIILFCKTVIHCMK